MDHLPYNNINDALHLKRIQFEMFTLITEKN